MRKSRVPDEAASDPREIDISREAAATYSSEDQQHPLEHLLDRSFGPGASHWSSLRADATERLLFAFHHPFTLSRLIFEAEETEYDRTQEVRLDVSMDNGQTYQSVLIQEYNFSPQGSTFQHEDLRLTLNGVTHLSVTVVPNKRGTGVASLTTLRLFS